MAQAASMSIGVLFVAFIFLLLTAERCPTVQMFSALVAL
jgi:hypothetical protein